MGTKSIGEKLKKVRTYQSHQKYLSDWAKNWKDDQSSVIKKLRYAAQHDDHSEIMHMIQQLEGMTEKRFTALNNVLRTISNPDRILENVKYEDTEIENENKIPIGDVLKQIIPEEYQITDKKPKCEPVQKDNIKDYTSNREVKTVVTEKDFISEIVKSYNSNMSIKEIAAWSNINTHKVIKALVTAGVYTSETYDRIKDMRLDGKSDNEIASTLGLSKSAMNDYTPYKKGIYNAESPTENAINIRKYRERNDMERR